MADVFSKKKRYELMSCIRGRNNKGTELVLASLLRKNRITGWRRHCRLPGTPDFALQAHKVAIFVDGCFWHGCRRCGKSITPSTNRGYWLAKIKSNRNRDRRADRNLRHDGWRVVRIWEHDLKKKPEICMSRIKRTLA
jgi:DNA mismatch endonuclease (patch repair protein)